MNTLFAGKNLIELEEVDSTNSFAEELLSSHPPEGTLIVARSQTAGQGQTGNTWFSQPGLNLTFSLVLYPGFLHAGQAFVLNKLTSLALQATIARFLPQAEVKIKWPNDLLVDRRKISGILIRNHLARGMVRATVLGIGINVNGAVFPEEIRNTATSLKLHSGMDFELKKVLELFLQNLEKEYLALKNSGSARLDRHYLEHLYAYQENATYRVNGKEIEGIIVGVGKDGRLALNQDQGLQHFNGLQYFNLKEIEFII